MLTNPATAKAPALDTDGGPQTLVLDWQDPAWSGAVPAPVSADVPPDAPAYVIYTSGSTGRPKGVRSPHAQRAAAVRRATEHWFGFGPDDVWTLFHSYAFDFSVWELWGALLHGGRWWSCRRGHAARPTAFLRAAAQRAGHGAQPDAVRLRAS